jgi:peptide/nickel transport system substrate-binding protein
VPKTFGAVIAIGGSAMALAACGSGGSPSATGTDASSGPPQRGGTLTVATPLEPQTLDPTPSIDNGAQHIDALVFDTLLEIRPGSSTLVPGLAESWKLGADRRSAIFRLRAARFSDGTPVTSEDVKFSLERVMNPKIAPYNYEQFRRLIQSISTPNPRTVVLRFNGARPAIFPYLAVVAASVVSKHAVEHLGDKRFAVEPLNGGSGPFKIVKWTRGQSVELERNPYYWRKGLPYLQRVDFLHVQDDNTRLLDVRSGQVDIADEVPYSQLEAIKNAPGVKLHVSPIAAVDTVFFCAKGPLRSAAVRQALNYATPKEVIKRIVLADRGRVANSVIPPMKYWDPNVKPYPYDVSKAKQMLKQAGMPNGFALELMILGGDEVSRQTATILQNAWARIGVKLQIRTLDEGTFETRFSEGSYQAALRSPTTFSSDTTYEDEFALIFSDPLDVQSTYGFTDPKLQALIKSIEGTWNESTRRRLFGQYQQEQMDNPIGVPIAVAVARAALRSNVEGFGYTQVNRLYLAETWIKH